MKKFVYGIYVVVLVGISLMTSCQNGTSSADPGTLDITVESIDSGVVALGTAMFGVYVYEHDSDDIYDPANCLALNEITIGTETENVRLKVNDGSFNPTAEDWIGSSGWGKYDLYILIDLNGTHDLEEGIGERTNGYPSTVNIDGETSLVINYADLTEW